MDYQRGEYVISTDRNRLDVEAIHDYLSRRSYWAQGRTLAAVRTSVEHSLCFGLYDGPRQAGFARVVTDYATFGWLCDVFVLEDYRSRGLGKWLIECVVAHPDLQGLRMFILATSDAHELYRRYGQFEAMPNPEKWMRHRLEMTE
jgi:GNAT superfamily N-acetyltransferase